MDLTPTGFEKDRAEYQRKMAEMTLNTQMKADENMLRKRVLDDIGPLIKTINVDFNARRRGEAIEGSLLDEAEQHS